MNWNYDSSQADLSSYAPLPVGNYRVRIEKAEEKQAKSGRDMISMTLAVSGKNQKLFSNMVFIPENPRMTNSNLAKIFDSFGISPGDMNLTHWEGKVGACRVKHTQYQGEEQASVAYFILKSKQDVLPGWIEPENTASLSDPDFIEVEDDDVPF